MARSSSAEVGRSSVAALKATLPAQFVVITRSRYPRLRPGLRVGGAVYPLVAPARLNAPPSVRWTSTYSTTTGAVKMIEYAASGP